MKIAVIADEAARGALSGTARTGWLVAVFGAVLTLVIVTDALMTASLVDDARRFRDSGAATIIVAAAGGIDGEVCDALKKMPGVQSAGATRSAEAPLVVAVLPRSPLDLYEVTAGFAAVIGVDPASALGLAITDEVAASVGGGRGAEVVTDHGAAVLAGQFAYPVDGRRPGYGWAAVVPSDTSRSFDECWLTVWPSSNEVRAVALTAVSATASSEARVQVSQLNNRHGDSFEGHARYSNRVTAFAPILAVTAAFAAATMAVRLRRLEYAARLHDGTSPPALAALAVCEVLVWLIPGGLIAAAAAAGVAVRLPGPDAFPIVASAGMASLAAVLAGVLGGIAAVTRVRERHLFAYFADR